MSTPGAALSPHRGGLGWAFLGVVLFSFSLPMTVWALEGFSPFFTATARAVIAGLVALVVLLVKRVPWPHRSLYRPLLYTMAGAVFGWPILIALALQRTTSAHTAVIAAIMPLTTAVLAVLRTKEIMPRQFWYAAGLGTLALIVFALSRGGLSGGDAVADVLIVLAVLSSSWCYVEGAVLTRIMPGWQVISWVVVLALPLTIPLSVIIWLATSDSHTVTAQSLFGLAVLGLSSMYLGFFAWYRGLAEAGVARGAQMQQLQAPLTLVWSVLLLGEIVTWGTLAATTVIIVAVAWAQRVRLGPGPQPGPPAD
ncbi:MAG: DMT family transporter [Actinomycetes bacterium]